MNGRLREKTKEKLGNELLSLQKRPARDFGFYGASALSTLTHVIDIPLFVCPSVRPSVRDVPDENGSTYRHSFFTVR